MRFAIFEQKRIEATQRAKGHCAGCDAELTSKCGVTRVWHWAHKGRYHCDKWWESETKWHRDWKVPFPTDWQEIGARSESGELHFADIKTPNGLVIEFQHSPIDIRERESREVFYGKMIWVLNGLRATGDGYTFSQHIQSKKGRYVGNIWTVKFNPLVPRITQRWINSRKTVYLDFGEDHLWRIPVDQDGWGKHAEQIFKTDFISMVLADHGPF